MGNYYTPTQANTIDRDNRQMAAAGIPMTGELEDIRARIDAGSIGIQSVAIDLDSLAKGGGAFTVDPALTTGLTLALQLGRVLFGKAVVTVTTASVTLSASQINFVEVASTGTVSANTAAFTAGRCPLYVVVTGVIAITTITSAKALLTVTAMASITGDLLTAAGASKQVQKDVADVSATTSFIVRAPVTGTLTLVSIANKTAFTTSDTDNWGFALVNKSNASVALLASGGGANTTAATGGAAISAYTGRTLTMTGSTANLAVTKGDVLEWTLTKTGAPADLLEFNALFDFTFTG